MDYNEWKAIDIMCLHSINVFCSLECSTFRPMSIAFCLCEATRNDIDRQSLRRSSTVKRKKKKRKRRKRRVFLNVERFIVSSSFSRFFFLRFPLLQQRGKRLGRKLKRLRWKMAPRDGNWYLHPLILSWSKRSSRSTIRTLPFDSES